MITKTQKIEAEVLRVGLICGIVPKREVVEWADKIVSEGEIDYIFIEISLSTKKHILDIESLLFQISDKFKHFDAIRCVLGRISFIIEEDSQSLSSFARGMNRIVVEDSYNMPSDLSFLNSIVDLAESGIYTIDEVDRVFLANLRGFRSEYSASPDWYRGQNNVNA